MHFFKIIIIIKWLELRVKWELINHQFWSELVRTGPKANLIFRTKIRAGVELDSWFHLCVGGTGTRSKIILINFFYMNRCSSSLNEVKKYFVQLCNKHYPIAECWMDNQSEQTLPNYKMLDGRWWIDKRSTIVTTTCHHALDKFPNTGWHFKLWSSLPLPPPPNWDEWWNWETFVFNYKQNLEQTTRRKENTSVCFCPFLKAYLD